MIVTEGLAATSNIDNRQAFTIKASAKAFKLLSSNLYSDKPLAIVREIGCNALDSHFMANKVDVPFKIVLPSDMHPYFEVIDYGTGLSDDQVRNIFTTYFESTKTTSNDQIGAMGLGSKSPFSYTDAFEVFARQDGVQNMYTCFLNQSGAPEIFLIETQKDDPAKGIKFENGVTIKVPVKSGDYGLFHNAARKAYKFFPVKPVVGANVNWSWTEVSYGFEGTNFKTMTNDKSIYALMGPVAYPIDLNQLQSLKIPADPTDPTSEETILRVDPFIGQYMQNAGRGFVIQYKIGDLDVNAGREGLSYDKTTIANLIRGMANIRAEMAKDLQDGLDKCKNMYEAIKYTKNVDPSNVFKLKFNGKPSSGPTLDYKFMNPDGTAYFTVRKKHYKWTEKLQAVRADQVHVNPVNGHHIILIDDKKLYQKKIRFADTSERVDDAFFIHEMDFATGAGREQFDGIIKKFDEDGVPWKYLSDVKYTFPERVKATVDPLAAKRAKVSYTGFYHFVAPFYSNIAVRDYKNLNDGELEDKDCAYIRWSTVEKRIFINDVRFRPDELGSTIWKLIVDSAAKANRKIVIVTDKVLDKIPEDWVDVSKLLRPELKLTMSKKTFNEVYGNWAMTGVDLKQPAYDDLMANKKVVPVVKEFFDTIRAIQFGAQMDYTTEEFIKRAYALQENGTAVDGLLKFTTTFRNAPIMHLVVSRYWSAWPEKDFRESVLMFSAMIAHGIIDENQLKEFLASK